MIKDGKLDKYGRKNESTPSDWLSAYTDYKAQAANGVKEEETSAKVSSSLIRMWIL